MEFENKKLRDVADIAARIMLGQQPITEKLHPNQQQLDVHEPEKDELTADDFKKLRAKKEVKKEEVEELDEVSLRTLLGSYIKKEKMINLGSYIKLCWWLWLISKNMVVLLISVVIVKRKHL
jgi:hypothetical protein